MKDLTNFLEESDKKKKSGKPRPAEKKEGKDDKKYVKMMEEYKRARRKDTKGAEDLMHDIRRLRKNGDVSENAKLAAAYI